MFLAEALFVPSHLPCFLSLNANSKFDIDATQNALGHLFTEWLGYDSISCLANCYLLPLLHSACSANPTSAPLTHRVSGTPYLWTVN